MKTRYILCLVSVAALLAGESAGAKDKSKEAKEPKGTGELIVNARPATATSASTQTGKEPWLGVKVVISDDERKVIQGYVHDCQAAEKSGRKGKGLPPGLAKKVARGGELPPGWRKKCVRGEIMSGEVYKHCHLLPPEVCVKLPPPPPGTILVTVQGKVVRLARATLEILDVFDVL